MNTLIQVLFRVAPLRQALYHELPHASAPPTAETATAEAPTAEVVAPEGDPLQHLMGVFGRLQCGQQPAVDPSPLVRALGLPTGEQQDVGEYGLNEIAQDTKHGAVLNLADRALRASRGAMM